MGPRFVSEPAGGRLLAPLRNLYVAEQLHGAALGLKPKDATQSRPGGTRPPGVAGKKVHSTSRSTAAGPSSSVVSSLQGYSTVQSGFHAQTRKCTSSFVEQERWLFEEPCDWSESPVNGA